jgi:putative ABC transport system permease protein
MKRNPFAMVLVAGSMLRHQKLKTVSTLLGAVFAVVMANQQMGIFLALLKKNTMYVDKTAAELWIAPAGTRNLQSGKTISTSALYAARATEGVAWAEPLLYSGGVVQKPDGGSEGVTIVGTQGPRFAGGPWNFVAGSMSVLKQPDAMVFEDGDREKFGGLNLGSEPEVNGNRMRVAGFTWGLIPFGPSYAFTDYTRAEQILHIEPDETHFVLVGLKPGVDASVVRAALGKRVPDLAVMTKAQFHDSIVDYLLTQTSIGISFGVTTFFAVLVGFVIVSLSMFSSVVDNLREFGTLKAIGARTRDLALLLLVQSLFFAGAGSLIGLALVTRMAAGIRSPSLSMQTPPLLFGATVVVMTLLCVLASGLGLWRIKNLEPGMVFR